MRKQMTDILDKGYLKLVETWGSDSRIIEAARMSTGGGFRGWDKDQRLLEYLYRNHHLRLVGHVNNCSNP